MNPKARLEKMLYCILSASWIILLEILDCRYTQFSFVLFSCFILLPGSPLCWPLCWLSRLRTPLKNLLRTLEHADCRNLIRCFHGYSIDSFLHHFVKILSTSSNVEKFGFSPIPRENAFSLTICLNPGY